MYRTLKQALAAPLGIKDTSDYPWWVIVNEEGEILAIYGNALGREAAESARRIEDSTGRRTHLRYVLCARPSVGQKLDQKGA